MRIHSIEDTDEYVDEGVRSCSWIFRTTYNSNNANTPRIHAIFQRPQQRQKLKSTWTKACGFVRGFLGLFLAPRLPSVPLRTWCVCVVCGVWCVVCFIIKIFILLIWQIRQCAHTSLYLTLPPLPPCLIPYIPHPVSYPTYPCIAQMTYKTMCTHIPYTPPYPPPPISYPMNPASCIISYIPLYCAFDI